MINPVVRWAFYVFAFSVPIEYPTGLPMQIPTVTAAVFLLTAMLQPALCFRRPPAAVWWLGVYLWVFLALAIFSEHAADSLKLFVHFLLAALLLWVGSNLMRDRGVARNAIASFILGCTAIATLDLLGVGTTFEDPGLTVRRTVFDQDANFLGGRMALAIVATLAMFGSLHTPRGARAAAAAAAGLLTPALIAAGSRGALLGAAAGLMALAVGARGHRARLVNVAIVLAAGGALAWAGYNSAPLRKRVEKTLAQGNMAGRERIYPEAWQMFLEKPLLGWGPVDARYGLRLRTAAYEVDLPRSRQERDAHNLLLEQLIACGLLGTIPFLMSIAICVGAAWHARAGPDGTLPLALIATVIALSMSANWGASSDAWLFFAYGLAAGRASPGGLA
jgi:O-antigen ligase